MVLGCLSPSPFSGFKNYIIVEKTLWSCNYVKVVIKEIF